MQYISNIELNENESAVRYGDKPSEAPADRVLELDGQSEDINSGFKGKYVWLVPAFTPTGSADADAALTGLDIAVQRSADPSPAMHDLAKGTGGDYRYLLLERDAAQAAKVTAVALLRLAKEMHSRRPAGWDGNTPDINKGRGGTYLYLLWKTGMAA